MILAAFLDSKRKIQMLKRVAVIGLGTMGTGIAQVFAAAGCDVICFDEVPQAGAGLRERIRNNLERMAQVGLVGAGDIAGILQRIEVAASEAKAVKGAEFVIEAVAEEMAVKQALFARLEENVSPRTILATNTSSLNVAEMTSHLKHQERVVVAHWFNPAHVVPVVEVVPGPRTSEETMRATTELLRHAGKVAVRLNRDIPGFIVNRVQVAMLREVFALLEQGVASAEDIDAAVRGSMGFRLAIGGPLEVCDFGGLDIWRRVFGNLVPQIKSDSALPRAIAEAVEAGHLGVKTGRGIYDYPAEDLPQRRAKRDADFLQLLKLFYVNGLGS
jgi:3-hydroxybutyryl-CoA dehydrogenase